MTVGDFMLTFTDIEQAETPEKEINTVVVEVRRGDDFVTTMEPQRNFHIAQQQTQSEVAIRSTPVEDLYVVVAALDEDGSVIMRAFVNPLTWWIWMGAAVMLGGMAILLMSPSAARAPARVRAEVREPAVAR